jgi:hypothetical protein
MAQKYTDNKTAVVIEVAGRPDCKAAQILPRLSIAIRCISILILAHLRIVEFLD